MIYKDIISDVFFCQSWSIGQAPRPRYFQQPSQLIDAFVALEEQNLFLIQNVQMAEHELEEVPRPQSSRAERCLGRSIRT